MSPWEKILERPHAGGHFVQLYESDESALGRNVGFYVSEGLKRGDGVLLIAARHHLELFTSHIDQDLQTLIDSGQLVMLDARETLAKFIRYGEPDWRLFHSTVSSAMRRVNPVRPDAGFRAYGEMVGVLWKSRQFAAAIRLEHMWNKLLAQWNFSLYCAYNVDIFGKRQGDGPVHELLRTHTHLVPADPERNMEKALGQAMDEVLGPDAPALRESIRASHRSSRPVMAAAEASVLWLRENLPGQAEEILSRARDHYHQFQHETEAAEAHS